MVMTVPTISMVLAAMLAIVNIWLSVRVGQVRTSEKVSVGDGGNDRVIRRMRAHANFAENAPIAFALVLVIELARGPSVWLWAAAVAFVLGRVMHGFGMDGWRPGRMGGTIATLLVQLGLAIWAITIPLTSAPDAGPAVEVVPAQG